MSMSVCIPRGLKPNMAYSKLGKAFPSHILWHLPSQASLPRDGNQSCQFSVTSSTIYFPLIEDTAKKDSTEWRTTCSESIFCHQPSSQQFCCRSLTRLEALNELWSPPLLKQEASCWPYPACWGDVAQSAQLLQISFYSRPAPRCSSLRRSMRMSRLAFLIHPPRIKRQVLTLSIIHPMHMFWLDDIV